MTAFRRVLAVVVVAAGIVLLVYWQTGGFHSKIDIVSRAEDGRPIAAGGVHVKADHIRIPRIEEAVGTVQSSTRVDVSPRIQATILDVRVKPGDQVRQGDVLVRLDPRDLEVRVGQAEQSVGAAEANSKQAQADFARTRELLKSGVTSAQEADNARLRVEITSATLGEARRAVEQAKIALSYAEIRSPVSGRVVEKMQNPGDMANPGRPIVVLYDPKLLRLEAPVREDVARRLRVGNLLCVRLAADETNTTGTIDEIVPQADPVSRSFLVKVLVPGATDLYAGMYGRLLIDVGSESVLVIPASIVHRVGQLEFVTAVRDGCAERRFVQTGRRWGAQVEVLAGLSAGDELLTLQDIEGRHK